MFFLRQLLPGIVSIVFAIAPLPAHSDTLNKTISTDVATNHAAAQSQKKIDKLNDQTRKLLAQYRSDTRQTETLLTYNQHLKELINSQQQEKASLKIQLEEIATTQQEIVPLVLNMLDSLEKFISLDIPFLPEERQNRLKLLKQMVVRADITDAEKFRRIIEAYQIENDYGNTIEAYRANLKLNGTISSVDFLRLGRVALYYQRLDGTETGFWRREIKQWEVLSTDYRNAILKGLRIARKETAPDLVIVPLPKPEAAQ